MTKTIRIQFEFDGNGWLNEGKAQIEKRRKKLKPERVGVKVNDRSLLKKMEAKKDLKKVELLRVTCFAGFDTTLLGVQATYRSYHADGTVREVKGEKFYFDQGELSFKTIATYDTPSQKIKLSFERQGIIVNARNEKGAQARVSPSMKFGFLRAC